MPVCSRPLQLLGLLQDPCKGFRIRQAARQESGLVRVSLQLSERQRADAIDEVAAADNRATPTLDEINRASDFCIQPLHSDGG